MRIRRRVTLNVPMNGSPTSIVRHTEPLACPRCRTAWRIELGLCVSCLLSCGLDAEMHNGQRLTELLDQIDMSDGD
jgi:hypothetical protein